MLAFLVASFVASSVASGLSSAPVSVSTLIRSGGACGSSTTGYLPALADEFYTFMANGSKGFVLASDAAGVNVLATGMVDTDAPSVSTFQGLCLDQSGGGAAPLSSCDCRSVVMLAEPSGGQAVVSCRVHGLPSLVSNWACTGVYNFTLPGSTAGLDEDALEFVT